MLIHEIHWYLFSLGPDSWVTYHPLCNGTKQSPINIIENKVIYNETLTPLILLNYSSVFDNASYYLLNNGHTVILGIELNGTVPIGLIWKGNVDLCFFNIT